VFSEAVNARLGLPRDLHDRLRTALQEAVMNAMYHGNLGLHSGLRDGLNGIAEAHATIELLLRRPAIARRPIRVDAIWNATVLRVTVRDDGEGFTKPELSEHPRREGHHGRGLLVLDAFCDRVAVTRGGTTVKLGFQL
jgi:anti-sigma regulatory factor (Ser/Thr protein kinase)